MSCKVGLSYYEDYQAGAGCVQYKLLYILALEYVKDYFSAPVVISQIDA